MGWICRINSIIPVKEGGKQAEVEDEDEKERAMLEASNQDVSKQLPVHFSDFLHDFGVEAVSFTCLAASL